MGHEFDDPLLRRYPMEPLRLRPVVQNGGGIRSDPVLRTQIPVNGAVYRPELYRIGVEVLTSSSQFRHQFPARWAPGCVPIDKPSTALVHDVDEVCGRQRVQVCRFDAVSRKAGQLVEDISSVVQLESATYFQNAPTGISRDVKTGTERRAFAAVDQACQKKYY
jgi:hypothetical protein